MGIFSRKNEIREESVKSAEDVLLKALMNSEDLSKEQVMMIPAVQSCVDFVSNLIASMPLKLYKRRDDKTIEVKDTRVSLLNEDTKDKLDGFQLKKAMVEDYLLGQGGYCFIQRRRNEVTGLYYVDESRISFIKGTNPIFKTYKIMVNGQTFRDYEFIKILRNTKDGASGKGLVESVSKALETAYNTMLFQLNLVKSGGAKKGFLKADRKLGQNEIDALKSAWKRLYGGSNEENVVVLNNGISFQEASATSTELQLNESKNSLNAEIYSIFHITGDFVTTFKEAIYPIVKTFETALNRDLLLEKEKGKYFFAFDIDEMTRASMSERYNAYAVAKNTGFLTINEIRDMEHLESIDGMNVINVGLSAVLYDVDKEQYFTPNTGQIVDINNPMPMGLENGGNDGNSVETGFSNN